MRGERALLVCPSRCAVQCSWSRTGFVVLVLFKGLHYVTVVRSGDWSVNCAQIPAVAITTKAFCEYAMQ
jgi:hypothetical protein